MNEENYAFITYDLQVIKKENTTTNFKSISDRDSNLGYFL